MSVVTAMPEAGLSRALFPEGAPHVLAVVGAGGKTSVIKTLAAELSALGRKVIITTTTKMHPPEDRSLLCDSPETVRNLLDRTSPVWAGIYYNEYKIEGLPCALSELADKTDHVLIEADGAKKRPLKMIDRSHEPVIPPEADAVLAVAGLDAVGKPVGEIVHRPELACRALGCDMAHPVTPEDIAKLLRICYTPRIVLLNKADTPELRAHGETVASYLPEALCVIARLRDFGHAETP